jgi:hypothetical protein
LGPPKSHSVLLRFNDLYRYSFLLLGGYNTKQPTQKSDHPSLFSDHESTILWIHVDKELQVVSSQYLLDSNRLWSVYDRA